MVSESELLVALSHIADPSAREQCRRRINKLNILSFKVSDTMMKTDRNHTGVSAWSAAQLHSIAPLLKSGPRKGWPKGGLEASIIEALDTMPRQVSLRPAAKGLGLKTRTRTNIKAANKVAEMIDSGKVEWVGDILTPV